MGRSASRICYSDEILPLAQGRHGRIEPEGRGVCALVAALDLYHGHLLALNKYGSSPGRLEQCAFARSRLLRPKGSLREFLRRDDLWAFGVERVLVQDETWSTLAPYVGQVLARARREARGLADERRVLRCASVWSWLDEQLRGGVAALHACCRPAVVERREAVVVSQQGVPDVLSLRPQHILEKGMC